MYPRPHSQRVRGTFDNPKTKAAMESDQAIPSLGDATSLKPENDNDTKLPSTDIARPAGYGKEFNSASAVSGAYRVDRTARTGVQRATGNRSDHGKETLPHSMTVRGTLANQGRKQANMTRLGDPVSLKAESSNTRMEMAVEREGLGKSKL